MQARFTGHPLIDAGLAAVTVMAGRERPEDLSFDDCRSVADWLLSRLYTAYDAHTDLYTQGPFKSYLVWLFPNSKWTTSSVSKDPRKASASLYDYAQDTLYAFAAEADPGAAACSFCGNPAVMRATRAQIPLLSGEFPNFSPQGVAGVPICGMCLLAVHALPLAGIATTGRRLMIMHSGDPDLLMGMARHAVKYNQGAMQMGRLGDEKLPYPRTRLVRMLREIESRQRGILRGAVTLYWLTNDNRKADLGIHRLTSPVLAFLREVEHSYDRERHTAWQRAISRAWKSGAQDSPVDEEADRNNLYEDLYKLPAGAASFLRQHILPVRSWSLTACFVRKVMGMDDDLLNLLYDLGTRFAAYAREKRSFYFEFIRETHYATWRRRLLGAADDWQRRGRVLISAEEFVQAFVAAPHAEFFDWRLARDIVALRMIEELARSGDITPEEDPLLVDDEDDDTVDREEN
ncbi:MAG: CRISPR-associated protein Cst1 [Anaerolineae bacterium]